MAYQSLIDRRVLFCHMASPELGRFTGVPLTEDRSIVARYNKVDTIDYYQCILNHAKRNDGGVLIPYNSRLRPRTILSCGRMLIWHKLDNTRPYIIGYITSAVQGENVQPPHPDLYTMPDEFIWRPDMADSGGWIELGGVHSVAQFPFHEYIVEPMRANHMESEPANVVLPKSRMQFVVGTRQLEEGE